MSNIQRRRTTDERLDDIERQQSQMIFMLRYGLMLQGIQIKELDDIEDAVKSEDPAKMQELKTVIETSKLKADKLRAALAANP